MLTVENATQIPVETEDDHEVPAVHLSQAKILCDTQHGFRERSCKSQLIVTIDDFMKCLNSKGLIHAIFLKGLLIRCQIRNFAVN